MSIGNRFWDRICDKDIGGCEKIFDSSAVVTVVRGKKHLCKPCAGIALAKHLKLKRWNKMEKKKQISRTEILRQVILAIKELDVASVEVREIINKAAQHRIQNAQTILREIRDNI